MQKFSIKIWGMTLPCQFLIIAAYVFARKIDPTLLVIGVLIECVGFLLAAFLLEVAERLGNEPPR